MSTTLPPQPPEPEPSIPITAPPPADSEDVLTPFDFTEERKFELYMHQRQNYTQGARDAYQRFDQTIVALSGGSIVLSITFMKDIGHIPSSLPWLFGSWASFLIASLCAFISLLTSGETDRERSRQLDCLVETGDCDESRAERLGRITTGLNYWALASCVLGVILIIVFATYNLLNKGTDQWLKKDATEQGTTPHPAAGHSMSNNAAIPGSSKKQMSEGASTATLRETAASSSSATHVDGLSRKPQSPPTPANPSPPR